jgi:hypothetical protein
MRRPTLEEIGDMLVSVLTKEEIEAALAGAHVSRVPPRRTEPAASASKVASRSGQTRRPERAGGR